MFRRSSCVLACAWCSTSCWSEILFVLCVPAVSGRCKFSLSDWIQRRLKANGNRRHIVKITIIDTGDNSGNSLDPTAPASPITKEVSEPFSLGKPVTSHDFSTLQLHMKGTIWVGGIAFDLVASA